MNASTRSGVGNPIGVGHKQTTAQLLVVLLLFSTLFIGDPEASGGSLARRITPADLLVVAIAGLALLRILIYGLGDFEYVLRKMLPFLGLWMSLNALFAILTNDGGSEFLVNSFAFLFLLAPLALVLVPAAPDARRLAVLNWGFVCVAAFFAIVSLLPWISAGATSRLGAAGLFSNVNHTASWAASALLVTVMALRVPRTVRLLVALSLGYVLLVASSFASILGVVAGLLYWALARPSSGEGRLKTAALIVLGAPLIYGLSTLLVSLSPRLSSSEATRSADGREEIWARALDTLSSNPLGVGFQGANEYVGREIHSDYLTMMVAFGPLGIVLLVMLAHSLWNLGGIATRSVICCAATTSAFHNLLSWRHIWVILAVAIMLEFRGDGSKPNDRPARPRPRRAVRS